jgi:hypothetical protein
MNFLKKLGLLNSLLFLIVIPLVGGRIYAWVQYYNSEKIQPALRENKAKQNTISTTEIYSFKPKFTTNDWSSFTGPDPETALFSVKYPPGCFAVRTYQVAYCSFNETQRMPSYTTVEDEVFYIDYSNLGNDFDGTVKHVIDQKVSSDDPWRLDDFQVLQEGKAIVDGTEAYLLKLRGKPVAGGFRGLGQPLQNPSTGVGKAGYVYENYLIFNVDSGGTKHQYFLYNESKEPSEYFDSVVSTIHFLRKTN